MRQETIYRLGVVGFVLGLLFIAGLSVGNQAGAVTKDEARVSLDQTEPNNAMRSHSQVLLSGSAYNKLLLNRDCVLADELICRDMTFNAE